MGSIYDIDFGVISMIRRFCLLGAFLHRRNTEFSYAFDYNFIAAEAVLLGFQHYIVMLGTTVLIPSILVPQMGGGNVRIPTLTVCFDLE